MDQMILYSGKIQITDFKEICTEEWTKKKKKSTTTKIDWKKAERKNTIFYWVHTVFMDN